MRFFLLLFFLFAQLFPMAAQDKRKSLSPFYNIFDNVGESFWGYNSLYHIGAIGSTLGMVHSGADEKIQGYFSENNPLSEEYGKTGVFIGWFWQIGAAGSIWIFGLIDDEPEITTAGAAGIQAIATTGIITFAFKFMSGRKAPLKNGTDVFSSSGGFERTSRADNFKLFNTDFSRSEGRFFWPSGHTSSTIAFVSAMYAFYPDKSWIAWIGYPLTLAMGLAVIENDSHWASDVIAGALIGHAIGYTTGRNFRRGFRKRNGKIEQSSIGSNSLFRISEISFDITYLGGHAGFVFSRRS